MSTVPKYPNSNVELMSARSTLEQNFTASSDSRRSLNSAAFFKTLDASAENKSPSFKFRTLDLGSYKMFFTIENGDLVYKFI